MIRNTFAPVAILAAIAMAAAPVGAQEMASPAPMSGTQISDLPAGHWATNATLQAVSNGIMSLEGGAFRGDRQLDHEELRAAFSGLASTAESIAGRGRNPRLRSAYLDAVAGDGGVNRLQLAMAIAKFLDSAAALGLVATAEPANEASRFSDLSNLAPAVTSAVDTYKVMTGYPDKTFRPNEKVTRYQMAAIALNVTTFLRRTPPKPSPQVVVVTPPPQPLAPIVVVVPTPEPTPTPEPIATPTPRFREHIPYVVSFQALNDNTLTGRTPAFNVLPLSATLTSYRGAVMLQNVTNVRVHLTDFDSVNNEFRLGLATLEYGPFQAIPYLGAHVGLNTTYVGTSLAPTYDAYAGATYGGILRYLVSEKVDLHAQAGQSALLGGVRTNSGFTPTAYPNYVGTFLTTYGVGADFYFAPKMALTVGLSAWQDPMNLATATNVGANGTVTTLGGNVGIGFDF